MQIQLNQKDRVSFTFFLQLKGKASPPLTGKMGEFISGSLMNTVENKKGLEYSAKKHPEEEDNLDRLMVYLIGGVSFFLILFKIVNPY